MFYSQFKIMNILITFFYTMFSVNRVRSNLVQLILKLERESNSILDLQNTY